MFKSPTSHRVPPEDDAVMGLIALMHLATGFWSFKVLAAALDLDLFTQISDNGTGIELSAIPLRIEARPAEMLLTACAALGLIEKRGNRYYNTRVSEEFLVRGRPKYFGAYIRLLDQTRYLPWHRLTEALLTNQAQTWRHGTGPFDAVFASPDGVHIFVEGMHSLSLEAAKELSVAFDFSGFTKLLDLGGGAGTYCIEAVRRWPNLQAVVLDLPPVIALAKERVFEARLDDRVSFCAADLFHDDIPTGADVILMSMVLHDWPEEACQLILQRCFNALPPRGAVIISELVVNEERTGPLLPSLMSLNMLVAQAGRNYTLSEYSAWLTGAGFTSITSIPVTSPSATAFIAARKA